MNRKCTISFEKKLLLSVIKFILLVVISYIIIQLSIEAKEIEEKRNIPGLQTTMEFAKEYRKGKYRRDWRKFGSDFNYPDATRSSWHTLELSSDVGMLSVYPIYDEAYRIRIVMKKGNNSIWVFVHYKSDLNIEIMDNDTRYYIEYENGRYIQNFQMEQETGFTTDEIVKQQDKIRNAFEEEMEKMHNYQIGRARERREKFTNLGFKFFLIFLLGYSFLKWEIINKMVDIEDEYPEEVITKLEEKFLKRRYLKLGCGISFWTYILLPVISEFILLPVEGTVNEYAVYGISAVISAVVFGLLWKGPVVVKTNIAGKVTQMLKNVLRFISSCVVTLTIIQLGIILVPRFYSPKWKFYKINLLADGVAFIIFAIIAAVKIAKIRTDYNKVVGIEEDL